MIVEMVVGALSLVLTVSGILTGIVGIEIVGLTLAAIAWGMLLEQLFRKGRS